MGNFQSGLGFAGKGTEKLIWDHRGREALQALCLHVWLLTILSTVSFRQTELGCFGWAVLVCLWKYYVWGTGSAGNENVTGVRVC